jgi:hypothetical protein
MIAAMRRAVLLLAIVGMAEVTASDSWSPNRRFRFAPRPVEVHEKSTFTAELYEGARLRSVFEIDSTYDWSRVTVSSYGTYVVLTARLWKLQHDANDPFAAIYRGEGFSLHELTIGDVFSPEERERIRLEPAPELDIRVQQGREILAVKIPAEPERDRAEKDIAIDLATGLLVPDP